MNGSDYVQIFFRELTRIRSFAAIFLSPALPWIELAAFIISVIFVVMIIYSLAKSKRLMYEADEIWDTLFAGATLLRRRTMRGWKDILKKIKSPDPAEWRAAVFEADKILGHVLRLSGYKGANVEERLAAVPAGEIEHIDDLKRAHTARERLAEDPGKELSREEAFEIMRIYRDGFKELELID